MESLFFDNTETYINRGIYNDVDLTGIESFSEEPTGKWWEPVLESFEEKAQVWDPLEFSETKTSKGDLSPEEISQLLDHAEFHLERCKIPKRQYPDGKVWGSEVGDDRVDACTNPRRLALGLAAQSVIFCMDTSYEDTFISNFCYNFCEITTGIPCGPDLNIQYAKKTDMKNLDFIDVPPVKLLIPVSKGKSDDPASSKSGKSSMLGAKIRSSNTKTCRSSLEIASFLSDASLATNNMKEPKYLPQIMGGCGVPDLFSNPWNTYAYVRTYKGGTYARLYGTATNELWNTINKLDSGFPAEALLCQRLRQKQDYLFGTYREKLAIPPHDLGGPVGEMPLPVYRQTGVSAFFSGVEQRLLRAKQVVTRTTALVQYQSAKRLSTAILGVNPVSESNELDRIEKRRKRLGFEGALSSNTAFKRLLERKAQGNEMKLLSEEDFLVISDGQRDFSVYDAQWLSRGHGIIYSLTDIPQSEDIFIMEEVSVQRTMRVPGLKLNPIYNGKERAEVTTKAKLGLWQVTETMEEWAIRLTHSLKEARDAVQRPLFPPEVRQIFDGNREYVSDDPAILMECLRDCADEVKSRTIYLISSDKKLARRISELTSDFVVRLEPAMVIFLLRMQIINAGTQIPVEVINGILPENFCEIHRIPPACRCYIDKGSVEANSLVLNYLPTEAKSYTLSLTVVINYGVINDRRYVLTDEIELSRYAQLCQAEIFWPNTIKLDFQVALTEEARPKLGKKIFAETPMKWLKRFIS